MSAVKDKVVLITGAARRVGAALARHLHQRGYFVIIHYHRSNSAAQDLLAELNQQRSASAALVQGDLNKGKDIDSIARQALELRPQIDVLINNASAFYPTPLGSATEHDWNDLINSNVKAPFFLSQALSANLSQARGCIINISDIFAQRPMPEHTIYCIAKAANNMLTKSMALELAPKVRVNAIAPGAILWPEDSAGEQVVNLAKLSNIPMAKLGGCQAIVDAAIYLIEQAQFVTGEILTVDGGRSLLQ